MHTPHSTAQHILTDVYSSPHKPLRPQIGAVADALCLNAGYALAACRVAATPAEGVKMAQEVQRRGDATATLQRWAEASQAAAAAEREQAHAVAA